MTGWVGLSPGTQDAKEEGGRSRERPWEREMLVVLLGKPLKEVTLDAGGKRDSHLPDRGGVA